MSFAQKAKFARFGLVDRVGRENVVGDFPRAVARARTILGEARSAERGA